MNLNEIEASLKTETRELEFKPAGTPTGMFFELRHESAPEVQKFMSKYRAKLRDLTMKRKNTASTNLMKEHEDGLRIVQVAGWTWTENVDEENGRPAFSKKELRALLQNKTVGFHLRNFIDEEVGSLDDFLTTSEDS